MRNFPRCIAPVTIALLFISTRAFAVEAPADVPIRQPLNILQAVTSSGSVEPGGAFATEIPVAVPGFREGLTPELRLAYRSTRANGFVGVGWSLQGLSTIERVSPGKGSPAYDTSDTYLLDGEPLVASTSLGGTHAATRQDFRRITKGATNWTVTTPDGRVFTYAPVYTTSDGTFRWGLSSVADPNGNTVSYTWACDAGDCYPATISYNLTTITFYRESRPSAEYETFATGAGLGSTARRIKSIDIKRNGTRVRVYKLTYATSASMSRSMLSSVQEFGRDCTVDSAGTVSGGTTWPPVTFSYGAEQTTLFENVADVTSVYGMAAVKWSTTYGASVTGDFNGDGRTDILIQGQSTAYLLLANSSGGFATAVDVTASYGMTATKWSVTYQTAVTGDFNADGKTDILLQGNSSTYLLIANASGGFNTAVDVTTSYGMTMVKWSSTYQTAIPGDFNGDGRTDVLLQGKTSTYLLTANGSGGFNTAVDLTSSYGMTSVKWSSTYLKAVPGDFNGDGRTDLLLQGTGSTYLLKANGSGFETVVDVTTSYGMTAVKWNRTYQKAVPGDFNGDGTTDLLLQGTGSTYLLKGNGGGFESVVDATSLYGMTAVLWSSYYREAVPGDYNGDGKYDLLLRGTDAANLLIADGSGGFKTRVDVTALYGMTFTKWTPTYRTSSPAPVVTGGPRLDWRAVASA